MIYPHTWGLRIDSKRAVRSRHTAHSIQYCRQFNKECAALKGSTPYLYSPNKLNSPNKKKFSWILKTKCWQVWRKSVFWLREETFIQFGALWSSRDY